MATAVGLFDNITQAQTAVQQLRDSGIDANEIGIAMQHAETNKTQVTTGTGEGDGGSGAVSGAVGGAVLGGLGGVVVGLLGLTVPGVGPILAAGPLGVALSTGLVGAGIGAAAGGLVGALTSAGVPEEEATMYQTAVERGGVLVTVRVNEGQSAEAQEILNRNGARDARNEASMLKDPNYRYGMTGSENTMSGHGTPGVAGEATGAGAGALAGAAVGTVVAGPLGTGVGAVVGGAAGAMAAGAGKNDDAGEEVGATGGAAAGAVTGAALGAIGGPIGMAAGAAVGGAVGGAAGKGTSDAAAEATEGTAVDDITRKGDMRDERR